MNVGFLRFNLWAGELQHRGSSPPGGRGDSGWGRRPRSGGGSCPRGRAWERRIPQDRSDPLDTDLRKAGRQGKLRWLPEYRNDLEKEGWKYEKVRMLFIRYVPEKWGGQGYLRKAKVIQHCLFLVPRGLQHTKQNDSFSHFSPQNIMRSEIETWAAGSRRLGQTAVVAEGAGGAEGTVTRGCLIREWTHSAWGAWSRTPRTLRTVGTWTRQFKFQSIAYI